jgi:hypothetical protein
MVGFAGLSVPLAPKLTELSITSQTPTAERTKAAEIRGSKQRNVRMEFIFIMSAVRIVSGKNRNPPPDWMPRSRLFIKFTIKPNALLAFAGGHAPLTPEVERV